MPPSISSLVETTTGEEPAAEPLTFSANLYSVRSFIVPPETLHETLLCAGRSG
jgi:hypothetical protein